METYIPTVTVVGIFGTRIVQESDEFWDRSIWQFVSHVGAEYLPIAIDGTQVEISHEQDWQGGRGLTKFDSPSAFHQAEIYTVDYMIMEPEVPVEPHAPPDPFAGGAAGWLAGGGGQQMVECCFYSRKGWCRYDTACRFAHSFPGTRRYVPLHCDRCLPGAWKYPCWRHMVGVLPPEGKGKGMNKGKGKGKGGKKGGKKGKGKGKGKGKNKNKGKGQEMNELNDAEEEEEQVSFQ